jgi:signal peptidase I
MTAGWAIATTAFAVLGAAAATGLMAYLRRRYVFVSVQGDSMIPALASGDRVLVRRGAAGIALGRLVVAGKPSPGRRWTDSCPDRGFESPWLVKRVAAIGAPPGTLILLGDNADSSWDSRQWGPCPADRVLGVVVRVFPRSSHRLDQASSSSRART